MNDVAPERHPDQPGGLPEEPSAPPSPLGSAPETGPGRRMPSDVEHPRLPLTDGQDDARDPIDYALTARARRLVAPSTLPDLSVLPAPPDADPDGDPHDTRPARARALRRSGRGTAAIAAQLRVSPELVDAWCRDVGASAGGSHPVRRSRSRRTGGMVGRTGRTSQIAGTSGDAGTTEAVAPSRPASTRLTGPAVAAMALTAAGAEISDYAVILHTGDQRLAAVAVRWLCAHAGAQRSRFRLLLEVPPGQARDLVAHQWRAALGLAAQQVRATGAPNGGETVSATLRISDAQVAAVVSEWRSALLDAADPAVSG